MAQEFRYAVRQLGFLAGALVLVITLSALLGGCSKAREAQGAPTAEDAVRGLLDACLAGKITDAAEFVEHGPAILRADAQMAKRRCDSLTNNGKAITYSMQGQQVKGPEVVTVWTLGYQDQDQTIMAGRQIEWTVQRKNGTWVVTGAH